MTRSAVAAPDAARRTELGACLRAYRELTSPGAAGLPERGRRRTPGLRREEVATLAGVGLSWYTWLEQGRVTASPEVIDAVGRVLGLDEEGRRHLRALAGPAVAAPDPDRVRADLAPLLAGWREGPAAVLDHRLDLVAVNDVWTRAWGGAAGENALEVLAVRARGAGPLGRADDLVRALARRFRMAANTHADDPRIAQVRARLCTAVPDLVPLWDCRGVGAFTPPDVTWQGTPSRAYLLHPTGEPGAAVLAVVPV